MVDTISKNSDLIERKEMFDRELSCEYFVEYYYYITHKRYEDALMKLNKVNPEYVFGENVGIYDSLYQVVGILLYKENREKQIELIHKKTTDIGRTEYFGGPDNYKGTVYQEINEFKKYWEFINQVESDYRDDQKVMIELTKLKSEVVRV